MELQTEWISGRARVLLAFKNASMQNFVKIRFVIKSYVETFGMK